MGWRLTRWALEQTATGCAVVAATIPLFGQAPERVPAPTGLVGIVWVQAAEDSGPNTTTFRPEGYKLPRTRGPAVKYTFSADGTLATSGPAAYDSEVSSLFDWRMREPNVFQMRSRSPSAAPDWISFQILTLTKDKFVYKGPLELTRKSTVPR